MRNIVVTKFGNEPNLFGDDLRFGMLGEWECYKLLRILSKDLNNNVSYYGKAKWDEISAGVYLKNVNYLDSSLHKPETLASMAYVDEFHVVLGPHSFYNGGKHISSWESIKNSIVTERLLERVAPQIKLINLNPRAKVFYYLSDRRFLLQAADLHFLPDTIYAQSLDNSEYSAFTFQSIDYTSMKEHKVKVEPFRFETLWLYGTPRYDYIINKQKEKEVTLLIAANQVTTDEDINNSRMEKILNFTDYLTDEHVCICGKWTGKNFRKYVESKENWTSYLDGLGQKMYKEVLQSAKYSLILFNTNDSPEIFKDNWLTVKYWECVFNGSLTFVEGNGISYIPRELQVKDGKELLDKIQKCENDTKYKNTLMSLQDNLIQSGFFDGTYYNNWLEKRRNNEN